MSDAWRRRCPVHSKEVVKRHEEFFRLLWNLMSDTVEQRVLWHCASQPYHTFSPQEEFRDVYAIVHADGNQRTIGMTALLGVRVRELQLVVLLIPEEGKHIYCIDAADRFRDIVVSLVNAVKSHALLKQDCEECENMASDCCGPWE